MTAADQRHEVIICGLAEGHGPIVAGSTPDLCSGCQAVVLVSPDSRRVMAQQPWIKLLCFNCVPVGEHQATLRPGQEDEIRALGWDPRPFIQPDGTVTLDRPTSLRPPSFRRRQR